MIVHFTKMHGLGNDFVVFDAIRQALSLTAEQVKHICDRHFGVGCDQLLLVESPHSPEADFRYRIFNSDGGEVEQCGNGARCFMRFVHDNHLSDKSEIRVETLAGIINLKLESDGQVTVNMGVPVFAPSAIPFVADAQSDRYSIEIDHNAYTIGVVSMGNPHAVLQVENVEAAPVLQLGPQVEAHKRFPNRVNTGFMQVVKPDHIRLRVYERGAGETLACGTGACAAVVIGIKWGLLKQQVRVELPGGELQIHWQGEGYPVMMTGPAQSVFTGSLDL